jgi:hypothetical protein
MTQLDLDLKQLCAQPPFRRFLLHIVRTAGILSPTAGASETLPFREGQRSLGLDILREASRGLPRGTSIEQLIALVLASETNPKETEDADQTTDIDRD